MKRFMILLGVLTLMLCLTAAAETEFPDSQTAVPEEDRSTRVYPLSDRRAVTVDNKDAKTIIITADNLPVPCLCYVVPEGTAHLRFELDAADNPVTTVLVDAWGETLPMADLLDPERNAYVVDQPAEAVNGDEHFRYNAGMLADRELLTEDPEAIRYFLIQDEAAIGDCVDQLVAAGYQNVRWEFTEPEQTGSEPAEAYVVCVVDQNNEPVQGLYVNFCTDVACMMAKSDENGLITFKGATEVYHVQLLKVPEGYSVDRDFAFYTESTYGNWILIIWKD